MAEIKTCEQYVLAELAEREKENEFLRNKNETLSSKIEDLAQEIREYRELLKLFKLGKRPDPVNEGAYLRVDNIYAFEESNKRALELIDKLDIECEEL